MDYKNKISIDLIIINLKLTASVSQSAQFFFLFSTSSSVVFGNVNLYSVLPMK